MALTRVGDTKLVPFDWLAESKGTPNGTCQTYCDTPTHHWKRKGVKVLKCELFSKVFQKVGYMLFTIMFSIVLLLHIL